jgi:4-hydroxybenzoate polyprenyltransferase
MGVLRKIKIVLEMIKFEHTIFALPFAYLGAILGKLEISRALPTWAEMGWITLAMVGARSAAMALNRLIDRHIDAKNPRTHRRAIPAGLLSLPFVFGFILISFFLFFYAAFQLNALAVQLLPLAVFFLVVYSYSKRGTWACHILLGIAIGFAPLGGWIATTGRIDGIALLLFATVALWIAGFDVIYACQDVEFDRKEGLHSIPARFGIGRALQISSLMHLGTAIGLLSLLMLTSLSVWYGVGVLITLLLLLVEHGMISAHDLSRLNTSFFTINGSLSLVLFIFTLVDVFHL